MTNHPQIVIADDEEHVRLALRTVLEKEGYTVCEAADGVQTVELLDKLGDSVQVLLLDIQMPGMDGRAVHQLVRSGSSGVEVIFMTAYSTPEHVIGAMREGAYEFLAKPFDIQEVKRLVRQIISAKQQQKAEVELSSPQGASWGMIGNSPKMQEVYKLIGRVAGTSASVLIEGESGTGKELICRAIHANSSRHTQQLVEVNCGAIPENLLESELFGHEKGAFTGATSIRRGKFEVADGGTIFLDEIAEMPLNLQVKLLRFLQERVIERVGGESKKSVDVRIVAATHRNLKELVEQGKFREDLYYRLHVVSIQVPPLRDRMEDIPLLSRYFFDKFVSETGKKLTGISDGAVQELMRHHWQGNVRELQNVIQRAVILAPGPLIQPEHVKVEYEILSKEQAAPFTIARGEKLRDLLKKVEREAILSVLSETKGNKAQAALRLGISRKALIYKCQEYEIEV